MGKKSFVAAIRTSISIVRPNIAKDKKRTLLRVSDAENACSARTTAYF